MFEGLYRSSPTSLLCATDPRTLPFRPQDLLAREKTMAAAGVRPPRRALSTNDYVYPTPPPPFGRAESRTVLIHQANHAPAPQPQPQQTASCCTPAVPSPADALSQRPPTIAEEVPAVRGRGRSVAARPAMSALPAPAKPPAPAPEMPTRVSERPKLGAPRRSYSVMDYEPVPPTHRPSANLQLADLPAELHYAIFDMLDPIDSTCLGLTSTHFYAIHRCMHGTVPLSARRAGPNDMEWVWHKAGRSLPSPQMEKAEVEIVEHKPSSPAELTKQLATLRVRGQALCRKCVVSRCELHTHIKGWMGPGYEYCSVRDKFGPPAPEGARDACFRCSPKDPRRCGRHHRKRST